MIKVTVGGATGKLGSMVCADIIASEDMELVGALVSPGNKNIGKEICPGITLSGPDGLTKALESSDVYVDLTAPDAAARIIADIPATNTNIILGTTAVPQEVLDKMAANITTNGTSAVIAANFAIGVNVYWKVCEVLAKYLSEYDIEVIEAHHSAKKDAPSGTTIETVKRLQKVTDIEKVVNGREGTPGTRQREIGVHSIRGGDIIGDHTVLFAKNMERIEFTHRSESRESFAKGCMESIRWIAGKKDGKVHGMQEVLDL